MENKIHYKSKLPPEFKQAAKELEETVQDYRNFVQAMENELKINTNLRAVDKYRLVIELKETRAKLVYKEKALEIYKQKMKYDNDTKG